jgi:chromate transporter
MADVIAAEPPAPAAPSFSEAVRVWAQIASLSFGGPAGQIAVMHRILVDEKKWISEDRFLHALNFCMLLPGPEAQQLATYVGWLLHGVRGGLVGGLLFILPGVVAIMALSFLYVLLGNAGPVEAIFFGVKAAVLAIVVDAVVRIGRRALTRNFLTLLAAAAFVLIFFFGVSFPLIIFGAAFVGLLAGRLGWNKGKSTPTADVAADSLAAAGVRGSRGPYLAALVFLLLWLAPVALILLLFGQGNVFADIAVFFSKMAVVTFGGAYAVLAYVAQQAVDNYGWLGADQMLDGLGMAETTPGPLIMVLQFVGFMAAYGNPGPLPPLLAATLGGLLATWVTFAPCFLWIFLGAPFVERLRGNAALSAALSAITAAVVGVILNLAAWFAVHSWFNETRPVTSFGLDVDLPVLASVDPWAVALSILAAAMIFAFRIGMLVTLAVSAAAGLALYAAGLI